MDNSISFTLGTPQNGWLLVAFHYKDFHLEFDASDVLNDPIEELFNAVTQLKDNEATRITWWLEPGAYFFDIERTGQDFVLTIVETNSLHHQSSDNTQIITITGDNKQIIEPIRNALRHFSSRTYEESQWSYNLDQNQVQNL